MNNLYIQKFQFLRFSENSSNSNFRNDIYGAEVEDKKIFISLTHGENYSQYLDLGLDEFENIESLEIYTLSGEKLVHGTHFYFNVRKVGSKNILIFGLKNRISEFDCKTFYLVLKTNNRSLYSNEFNYISSKADLAKTTLITYWHDEDFYNANYFESLFVPQQFRVPMYYSHNFAEVEAENYNDTYRLENNYRSGKVKRLFMESWKVIFNDANYNAFSVALDSDHVYFNNMYFTIKPFNHERDKDEKGFTVSNVECQRYANKIFDQGVFGEFFNISSDDIAYDFEYDNEPENTANAGQWFLVNRIFNNYRNDYGVNYDCNLKFEITKIPTKGFIANNLTRNIYVVGSKISYCEKDDLVYFPNGFDNDLGINANFSANFKYKIVDQNGNKGNEITQTINMIDLSLPEVTASAEIAFFDNTTAPKEGSEIKINILHIGTTEDPLDLVVASSWQKDTGTGFVYVADLSTPYEMDLAIGTNRFRLKCETASGAIFYSNVLTYECSIPTYPTADFWFKSTHPSGYPADDYVDYLDEFGNEQRKILEKERYVDYGEGTVFEPAPCTRITASSIVDTFGAISCTP